MPIDLTSKNDKGEFIELKQGESINTFDAKQERVKPWSCQKQCPSCGAPFVHECLYCGGTL